MNIAQAYFFRSTAKYLARTLPALALIGLVKYLPSTSSLKSLLRRISGVTGTPSMLHHHVPQGPSSSSLTAFRLTTPFLSLRCRSGWISVTMHKVSFGNMQSLFVCTMSPILRSSALIIVGLLSFFSLKVFAVLQCLSLKLNCSHFYKSFYVVNVIVIRFHGFHRFLSLFHLHHSMTNEDPFHPFHPML